MKEVLRHNRLQMAKTERLQFMGEKQVLGLVIKRGAVETKKGKKGAGYFSTTHGARARITAEI